MTSARYDTIGKHYGDYRRPDPRIARQLLHALGDAQSILNVGAGVGAYEPLGLDLIALEPSRVMIDQRPSSAAAVVQGVAESLPFADDAFDAVMSVLSLHHWRDQAAGLREICRVARDRCVLLSWVGYVNHFWLSDYFPEMPSLDDALFPSVSTIEAITGLAVQEAVVPVPGDCSDGFMCAHWKRPQAYLDPGVRGAISTFSVLPDVDSRIDRLRSDIDSGCWQERNSALLGKDSMDYGYRVLLLEHPRRDGMV